MQLNTINCSRIGQSKIVPIKLETEKKKIKHWLCQLIIVLEVQSTLIKWLFHNMMIIEKKMGNFIYLFICLSLGKNDTSAEVEDFESSF